MTGNRNPLYGGPRSQHSRAGRGLESADAKARFGDKANVGAAGERSFANIVRQNDLGAVSSVFYSLSIPTSSRGGTNYRSDVDAALLNGNTLVLVDVKSWKGNFFYWSIAGLPFRGAAPLTHGGQWKLSANMAGALRRYREAFPGMNISAMVIFVPTQRGNLPTSVRWLKWPGGINSYQGSAAIKELRRRMGNSPVAPDGGVAGRLAALQR